METYTEQEFMEIMKKQQEINFLAAAITPWHALGIDAAIYLLKQQGVKLKGYIMIVSHPLTGIAIDEDSFFMKSDTDIEVIELKQNTHRKTIHEKIKVKLNKYCYYIKKPKNSHAKEDFYWVTPLKPSYELIPKIAGNKPNHNLKIMITDEGLGSYLNTAFTWWRYSFVEGGLRAGVGAVWSLLIRDKFFLHQLTKRKQVSYHQLLKRNNGKWDVNGEASEAYKHIFSLVKNEKDYSYYAKSVIINTEMLYEIGILKTSIDIAIYQKVCEAMKAASIPVILKIHPREEQRHRYKDLNCYQEENYGIAQENIFAMLPNNPYCVLGINSTTLVTAKVLFGIEAISIIHLIDQKDLNYKNEFKRFEKTFSNILYMPKTITELLDNINEIKDKYEKE